MQDNNAIRLAAEALDLELPDKDAIGMRLLSGRINDLLVNDFNKLVSLLYRMDISEMKLRRLLEEHPGENAADLIAMLVVERQTEKLKTRETFRQKDDEISDEEKW